jgi:hypothetical protein
MPELLARAVLGIAAFMVIGSLLVLAATKPGTPERTITEFALGGGLLAIAGTAILIRLGRQGRPRQEKDR